MNGENPATRDSPMSVSPEMSPQGESFVMPQRKLLLLGCGLEQIEALRIARELGYRTVAFDNDPRAAGREHADEFIRVDLKDPHALLGQAEIVSPDGVFVHAAELAVEAACVAATFNLPGIRVDSARAATDKHLRIARLSKAGLSTPAYQVLSTEAQLEEWSEACRAIGFPCVLKPTGQAGARGVEEIRNETELTDYYRRRGEFKDSHFVCEARLVGCELSTESVAANGKILHHALALRHYDTTEAYRPYFIEDGHSLPFELAPEIRATVEQVIARSFEALDIQDGVLKGDLLIDSNGRVHVLEMAARTSGGRFADTVVPLGTGVNILYPLIELAMGDAFTKDWFAPTRSVGVSQRFFLHEGEASVDRWPKLRELVSQPYVSEWRINDEFFREGRLPHITSHRDRFGYVICTGATREEADARALEITNAFGRDLQLSQVDETTAQ